ncbi:hypothetical protein AHAS_Ahas12G0111100 [Arachis hypogaea]
MSILNACNELICWFRPAPDAIRLASKIRHSSGIISARFQILAGTDSPTEACVSFSWKLFHIHGRSHTIIHI